ncbi:MAG TPA: serine/threonine-protein kinase [Kofleriaceae bacterium]|nr:serine/threonine-protein kinase [Kofleriaceae bacterium]
MQRTPADDTRSEPTAVEGSGRRPRARDQSLTRGTLIGRYVVLDRLGAGGMGVVYAGYDPDLNRRVALKLVYAYGEEGQARMMREAQALARLAHPNVVAVYDVGTAVDRVFLAMELVEGKTLSAWCEEPRSWHDIVAIFAAAGHGLAAAHAAGIVHRDFKPNNVLVGSDGRARVLDFGLARAAGELIEVGDTLDSSPSHDALGSDLTQAGALLGTPVYMAPEALRGEPGSAAGDQFSFCVALYEALYGARPFDHAVGDDALPPVPPPPANTKVPAWLRRVVVRGLAFAPADRFPSMDALLAALADDPAVRRRKLTTAAGATVAAVGLVAGGLGWRAHVRAERLAEDPCAVSAPFGDTWDSPAHERLQAAFRATGAPGADAAFTRMATALDDLAHEWIDARAHACVETRDDHAQPEAVLLVRLSCLDREKDDFGEMVSLFEQVDNASITTAAAMVHRLRRPAVCADPHALSLSDAVPVVLRPSVKLLRARLLLVDTLTSVSSPEVSLRSVDSIIADARRLGYGPLVADAMLLRCEAGSDEKNPDRGAWCEDAELAAVETGVDHDAARAATMRFSFAIEEGQDAGATRRWQERARVWIARSGAKNAEARFEGLLGVGAMNKGDYPSAVEHFERDESLATHEWGADSAFVAQARTNRALALSLIGRYDEAIELQQEVIASLQRTQGEDTDDRANALDGLGYDLALVGRYREAREALERGLATPNAQPSTVAATRCDLARVDLADGHLERAIEECEQGLANMRTLRLAKFTLALNEDPLAAAYLAAKRYDDTLRQSRDCLADFRNGRSKDSIEMVPCLRIEGTALVELGRASEALGELELALKLQSDHPAPPGVLAELRFQLARALVASGGDRARAAELAADARAELVHYPFAQTRVSELDAWRTKQLPP